MGDRSGSEAPQPAAVEEVSGASGRETSRDPKRTRLRSNQKTPSVRKAVETHEEDCCNPSRMRIYIYIYRERERERERRRRVPSCRPRYIACMYVCGSTV
eukprot:GHVU01230196.1.p6 GENE.GHVU01230196.1~~GHVU01230196.1.p6  ORF type:complete len:100 (-),score=6.77 GHVU01230196.1:2305-2604(-)